MGLDMYLVRKIYTSSFGDHIYDINVTFNGKPLNINSKNVLEIVEEVGYWRKANAIHKWFVENVQDGKDDCGYYSVTKEDVENLLSVCKKVIEHPNLAHDLLPTTGGFFFGGTEYNEFYFQKLESTVEICNEALRLMNDDIKSSHFYYHSSW